MERIKVILCGAAGKMGCEIIRSMAGSSDLELVGAVDRIKAGTDAGLQAGAESLGITISSSLDKLLASTGAGVLVDFTSPTAVMENIRCALEQGIAPVIGTTGLSDANLRQVEGWVRQFDTGAIIAPNFALGAVLMMKMAQFCARYMNAVEIIELHHDEKLDAPSGTARKTAQLISEAAAEITPVKEVMEKDRGVRGGQVAGISIHSVRLPGLVAHQEVIFGGEGQLLTLRHDAMNRSCFIPGLFLAIRRAPANKQLIYGIENLIE